MTARWGITPNLTLNTAINPDFSQIEAESAQLDVNNTFALFFNEKRPFFLDDADFFETPLAVVYTRTIAEPDWGAKLTGKEGAHGGGVFFARDSKTNILIPGSQGSGLTTLNEQNLTGVLRYRRDFGKNANVGATFTTRSGGEYSNQIGGLDGYWQIKPGDTLTAQVLMSGTEYPDDVAKRFDQSASNDGHAILARYRHSTRNWYWAARYEDVGEGFRADTGFMPQVGCRYGIAQLERIWWPKDGQKTWWSRIFWGGDYDRRDELASGETLEEEIEMWLGVGGPK